jgi:hypothetical protein
MMGRQIGTLPARHSKQLVLSYLYGEFAEQGAVKSAEATGKASVS